MLLAESPLVLVWAVDFSAEDVKSIDLELYQSLIDQLSGESKAIVFASLNRTATPKGTWTVGLRRCGDVLNLTTVSSRLGDCSDLGFLSGGGHPYAAGAACSDFALPAERVCQQIAQICTDILALAAQTVSH